MSVNTYYLELMSILLNMFQPQKSTNKTTKAENLVLKKKKTRGVRKKPGWKFIRINASNAKEGYDTDYEVSKIQPFFSKFKEKKKRKRKQNKRTRRQNKKN